jgi:type VI secretion system protein ImpL
MSGGPRRWIGAGTTTITFIATAWILGAVLQLSGVSLWVLRIGLTLLGAAAGWVVYRLFSDSEEEPGAGGGGPGERDLEADVDQVFSQVRRRLSSAGLESGRIEKRPSVLLLGPRGGTKTSLVEEGGLDAELLAGEVRRGDRIVPTEVTNVWLAGETLLVEAGGDVLEDDDAWSRLARQLRPSRLAAVLGRGRQPPRTAVVCFPCDELLAADGPDALAGAGREIRERLHGLAGELGIRLPVYAVFTKADRIPYFREFVEHLDHAEAREVLGATLPPPDDGGEGAWADRQAELLDAHFDELVRSLALKRPELLARSGADDAPGAIYEFPRELRKARDRAVRFLVELCRPSRLRVSPVLRGFYFTGVRPVVAEGGRARASSMESVDDEGSVGATMAFDARSAAPQPEAREAGGSGRRVPQWVFARDLFRKIVLGDPVARAVTAGGSRVDLLRRALAGSAAALALVFLLGVNVSFFRNDGLQEEVLTAVERAESLGAAETGRVTLPELRRLDTLGTQVTRLRRWETDGPPLSLRWGLYSGDELLPPARSVYFDRLDPELGRAARQRLAAFLRPLPETSPDSASSYGDAYNALKAYLLLTSEPERSNEEFLVPVLMEHWRAGRDPGPEIDELARRQFAVYARELKHGNPYDVTADGELVGAVRDYLRRFTQTERFYKSMVARASQEASALRFSRAFPGASDVLTATHTVPGAFTREGWAYVQENLDNVSELLAQEEWVTGGQAFSEDQLAELSQELEERYVTDYVDHWRRFLASVRLTSYTSVGGAARSLADLSGNRSSLLQLLALVANQTSVDSARVGYAFQPVRAVAPPDTAERYIVQSNRSYVEALGALQSSLEQVVQLSGGARDQARSRALQSARQVQNSARQMAQGFAIEGQARVVGNTVRDLLQAPGSRAGRLLERLPVAEANARARQFCREFRRVSTRYPFAPGARQAVSLEDLNAVFQPGESALWSFYDDVLSGLVARQGSRYRARSDGAARPTGAAVEFINQAAAISRSLYGSDGSSPRVDFILNLETSSDLPRVSFAVDGQKQTFTRTLAEMQRFSWRGERAQYARIAAGEAGSEATVVEAPNGTWALFRLFQAAEWENRGGSRYGLRWPVPGRSFQVRGELLLNTPAPIFDTSYLAGIQCPSTVAR